MRYKVVTFQEGTNSFNVTCVPMGLRGWLFRLATWLWARLGLHNRRLGRISQLINPYTGSCGRCHTTWTFVCEHDTPYSDDSGCFPLCEKCWAELTPEQRLPYYRRLWESWPDTHRKTAPDGTEIPPLPTEIWWQIQRAVLAGK